MCNNEDIKRSKGGSVKEYTKASIIWRRSRKRNTPQTEEFPFPYDPKVPHEDDCLMQED